MIKKVSVVYQIYRKCLKKELMMCRHQIVNNSHNIICGKTLPIKNVHPNVKKQFCLNCEQ